MNQIKKAPLAKAGTPFVGCENHNFVETVGQRPAAG